jgi:hypothetical protein
MKDSLPYFSHDNDARRHPKMKALIAEYGYEGYGRFWALNERIAESSGAYIDISKKVNKLDLANELGMDGEHLDRFLTFLSDPEIDLITIADNKITTDRVAALFSQTMENREHERNKKRRRRGKREIPDGNSGFPDNVPGETDNFPKESDTDKTRQDKTKQDNIKQDETKQDTCGSAEPPLSESQKAAIELSELLLTSHRKVFPDFLSGKSEKQIRNKIEGWAVDIEYLIRLDKKAPETIRQVILWVKTPNNFWFSNIESGSKLRAKFQRLYEEMVSKKGTQPKGNNPRGFEEKISLKGL